MVYEEIWFSQRERIYSIVKGKIEWYGIPCENTHLHGGIIGQEAQSCGEEQCQSESDQHKGQPAHEPEIHARI